MPEIDARKVRLIGGGVTGDGEHGAMVFAWQNGQEFALAVEVEQFADVIRAAAMLHSQARKLRGEEVPPIPVERWSTAETPDSAILSLQVFGGLELRFELSRDTQATDPP